MLGHDILGFPDLEPECLEAKLVRRRLDPFHFQRDERAVDIAQHGHPLEAGQTSRNNSSLRAAKIGLQIGQPGHIAARPRQAD